MPVQNSYVIKMTLLTKSKYLSGLQCPKLIWILFNEKDNIPEIDRITNYRFSQGKIVGELAKKAYPDGIDIPSIDFIQNIYLTESLLKGNKPLFEAGIQADDIYSRIDVLRPNGDGTFDIIEVKSSTQVKQENIEDVSFQRHCCERARLKIKKCYLMFLNNKYVRQKDLDISELFSIEDITDEVIKTSEGIQERIDGMLHTINSEDCPAVSTRNACDKPYECSLIEECWKFLSDDNVFTLYAKGKTSAKLFEMGIRHIKDIPEGFELNHRQEIQKVCGMTGDIHIQKEEIWQFLDGLKYPSYYLDFETFAPAVPKFTGSRPYQRIPFQFSLHVSQNDDNIEHKSFLADGTTDPRPAFLEQLKNALGTHGTIVVYNEVFEKGVLKELARDFPEYGGWVNEILPRIIDLLKPFRAFHYYNPVQNGSASIKDVLPAITNEGYEGMKIDNGMDASISFEEITFGDVSTGEKARVRSELEEYCKMDTFAEVRIVEELRKICQ